MKLWSGRIPGSMDSLAAQLNDSLPFDRRLAQVDVRASLAWSRGLVKAQVISTTEGGVIAQGLNVIQEEFTQDIFIFEESDEDIHTAVERRLTELIGPVAGKLHTGRSRNDQVATDLRLWIIDCAQPLKMGLLDLQAALIRRAEKDWGVVLPGYTHFQQAQPILFSHWWLSHFWALQRDRQRLDEVCSHTRVSPLGSGALAGTSLPIDRLALAGDLGFPSASANSLDGVSDRDFAAEFLFWASLVGVHLSRMAEALILYSTREFGFVTLADEYSTGSSLMPQKKNPDPLELVRAKSSLLTGRLSGLLGLLKALPSAYDKDLQEDKPPVFEAADTVSLLLPVMTGLIESLKVHAQRCREVISWQLMSTDLADYLVSKGVPFRAAHAAVGQAVRRAESLGIELPALPLTEWQAINPAYGPDLFGAFDVDHSLSLHAAWGGTAPEAVQKQLELAKSLIS